MRSFSYLLLFLTLGSGTVFGQWLPVLANVRETVEMNSGAGTTIETHYGSFYRASDGSTLLVWYTGSDRRSRNAGELFDHKGLGVYDIDYERGTAFKKATLPSPRKIPPPDKQVAFRLRAESIEGVQCEVGPAMLKKGDKTTRIGEFCYSSEYFLVLREDVTLPGGIHKLYELEDIHLNTEPDSAWFDVSGLSLTGPTPD